MKAMQKLRNISNFLKKAKSQPAREEYEEEGVIVVLKFNVHCGHCAEEVKNCIKKSKGVASVDLDVSNSQVTVEGLFDVQKLVYHIFSKAKKRVQIVKQEKAGGGNNAPSPPISPGETNNNEECQREESDDHSHEVETEKEIIEEKGGEMGKEKIGEIEEAK